MITSARNGFSSWFHIQDLHLFRQVVATFASCMLSATGGFTFGHTAVLLPQLAADENFPYDKGYDSWIASISPFAMIFGCVCSGPISDAIGRRKGQLLLIIPFTLGWIITGLAGNNATIIAGRVITGICTGAIRPVGMVYIGEISNPKYRSTTLFCPGMAAFLGSLICHLTGRYMSWRLACYMFTIPNILCFIIQMWLKESPLWLLSNGHTEEGVKSFEWFRGNGETAEIELKAVMANQNQEGSSSWKQFVFTKSFLKSIVTIFFICVASQMCGINTVSFYAIEMFESTFGGEIDAFLLMIAVDILRVIATGSVCFIAKRLPTRLTYLIACFGTSLVLVGLVTALSTKPAGVVWASLICLIAFIMIAGIMSTLGWSFIAEIFPSRVRGFGSGLSALLHFCLLFVSVKVTPPILNIYGEAAMYGSFALFTLLAAFILIFMLPETQGKTLQDIENELYKTNDAKEIKCPNAA